MNRTRQFYAGILDDVVAVYDQTKTTLTGRSSQKIVNGQDSVGPPLTKFIDVFSDTGLAPVSIMLTANGRLFIVTAPVGGLASILLYNFNLSTGASSYVGRLQFNVPNTAATTHTIRGLKVMDAGTSGWKIFVATTGTVLVNGGLFLLNSVALSDFVPVGFSTLVFGTSSDQKAVYFLQSSTSAGAAHLMTQSAGLGLDTAGTRIYHHNGIAATHQYRSFDYSTAPDNPGQTATITIATPGVVTAVAHGYGVNDQVVLSTTGNLPTGLVAGTVYFVRNQTANTFELSATSGGASINTTGAQTGVHTVRRAFGIATNLPVVVTGNLPALTGTLLLVNSEYFRQPTSGPNAGFDCMVFATSTNIYSGRASEITNGATTWPSLQTVNILGSANEVTAPTASNFCFSALLDRYIYVTNGANFVSKLFVNNAIAQIFGGLGNLYQEGMGAETVAFEMVTLNSLDVQAGWLMASGATIGQRGIFVMDYRSDTSFDYSSVISKVITIDSAALRSISTYEALFDSTGTLKFYYRTSGFGSPTGGWVQIAQAEDLSAVASGTQIQFKVLFDIALLDASTPAQLIDLLLGADPIGVTSEKWMFSRDLTNTNSPAKTAFVQDKAYGTAVPKLTIRAYNRTSKTLVLEKDTVAHAAEFEYSSNNGLSWNPLGAIPDGAGTTAVRYNWSSPPGVDVIVGLSDE